MNADLRVTDREAFVLRADGLRQPPLRLVLREPDDAPDAPGTAIHVTAMHADGGYLWIDGRGTVGRAELRLRPSDPRTLLAHLEAARDAHTVTPYRTPPRALR